MDTTWYILIGFFFIMISIVSGIELNVKNRQYPTAAEVDHAHSVIVGIIEKRKTRVGRKYSFPFRAGFVRLAFHVCVGQNGCDGCVDHSIPDNKGLKIYTDALDKEYTVNSAVNTVMSKADFYILAGYVALEEASKHQRSPSERIMRRENFKVGRITCLSMPPPPNPPFPAGTDELNDANDFFNVHFSDFTTEDKVAILGAHTLGETRESNLGFEGKWVNGKKRGMFKSDLLDNEYYRKVNGNKWTQVDINSTLGTKKQWQRFYTKPNDEKDGRRQPHMLLNMDMSMQFDLKTNGPIGKDGTVSCKILIAKKKCISPENDCCQHAKTNIRRSPNNFFKKFLFDNVEWISAFKRAFNKMTQTRLSPGDLQFPKE